MNSDYVIWKFPVDGDAVPMPKGARILHVGTQTLNIFVWALCDPKAEFEDRAIKVAGTGWPLTGHLGHYLGTVYLPGGLVFHLFDTDAEND